MDVLTPEQRHWNMSRIRGGHTKPELLVRKALHAAGLRYRLHPRTLPGRPDLVFPKHRAVIFVHGCFWHGHDCPLAVTPATRTTFWQKKIGGNAARDRRAVSELLEQGWRVGIVWECAMRGPTKQGFTTLGRDILQFVTDHDLEMQTFRGEAKRSAS